MLVGSFTNHQFYAVRWYNHSSAWSVASSEFRIQVYSEAKRAHLFLLPVSAGYLAHLNFNNESFAYTFGSDDVLFCALGGTAY